MTPLRSSRSSDATAFRALVIVSGIVCMVLGLCVIVGWHTRTTWLLQISPAFAPMQYNTAIGFVLAGAGLLTLPTPGRYARRTGYACAVLLILLGAVTLAEYLFRLDIGIDRLLLEPYVTTLTSHPGRMAPNTSVDFLLVGFALAFAPEMARKPHRALFVRVVAALGLAIAVIALVGYLFHVETGFGWASLTRMAVHTAAGLCVATVGLFAYAHLVEPRDERRPASARAVVLAPLAVALVSLGAWIALDRNEIASAHAAFDQELRFVRNDVAERLQTRVLSVRRMGRRWTVANGTPYGEWRDDARHYLEDFPQLQAIEWIDPTFHIRWIEPLRGNEAVQGMDVRLGSRRISVIERAMASRSVVISAPLALVQGGEGVLVYVPVYRHATFDGFIVGVLRIDRLLQSAVPQGWARRAQLVVTNDSAVVFQTPPLPQLERPDRPWTAVSTLTLDDVTLRLTAAPGRRLLAGVRSPVPEIVLIAGILTAFLLALVLRSIFLVRHQALLLATSEETFRSAMEHAPIGKGIMSPQETWMNVNDALCRMLGYTRDELLGLPADATRHPDDVRADADERQQLVASMLDTYSREIRYLHKDGHVIWTQLHASLIRNGNGSPRLYVVQIQDVTHRRAMEQMKDEFVSMVSHELRTPMTSIRGSLGLIIGTMSDVFPEKARRLLHIAHQNSERLILLVNDILDMEKIASGRMRFDLKPGRLDALLHQAVESNQSYGEQFGVTFALGPIDPRFTVSVDTARFMQVMANLLSNAAKFSPTGGTVQIMVSGGSDTVYVAVADHGQGIPGEFRSRIFDRFSQADSSTTRARGGTGLGLHITKQLVEHMGGHIWFETADGRGTTFWIELPVTPGMARHGPVASHDPAESRTEGRTEDRTTTDLPHVLICDRRRAVALRLATMLTDAGFATDIATSVPATHVVFDPRRHEVILLNAMMISPDDDTNFVRQLRARAHASDLPIVMTFVDRAQEDDAVNGSLLQLVDWLPKPVDETHLAGAIRRILAAHERPPRILHVEDDAGFSDVLAAMLAGKANLVTAPTLADAERLLGAEPFDLVVLDLALPDGSGLHFLTYMRERGEIMPPVLVLSAKETSDEVRRQIAESLVKSRMSESKIVETILSLLPSRPTAAVRHRNS